ncbi:hypothetical protein BKP37_02630 [Anaerobacillus alkalilacustris]|uniref:Rho termination factor N-terminal domain-containing protein n=1 Tax=Anaerobacillus alkalilacustris TaxID=393763 RepID=A0A1S2M0D9_9BACI|nr:tetratricopeptide repeat protein [Anaerobacillus alkalilacustris]OIJ17417.1 hypothetical protein BKP37_02630 [Anaerobacillus alkalilacustris]
MKKNHVIKKKIKTSSIANTLERLNQFQTKQPQKFKQVFDYYQKGQNELNHGLVHQAKDSFEAALRIYREYIPAQNYLAVIHGLLNNYLEALKIVKQVIRLDDKNVFAYIQGAIFLYRLDRKKEAEAYSQRALHSFHEREGHDSYTDYDLLQKLVEMLSVLREDETLSKLYHERKSQLSPMSLYRSALSLSNEGHYDEARVAFQTIYDHTPIKEQVRLLDRSLKLFVEVGIPVPLLFAEEEEGFKLTMAVASLFDGEETKKQASFNYIKNNESVEMKELIKRLLKTNKLEDWVKKSLLSILADFGEAMEPITVLLDGEIQLISLQPVELTLNENLGEVFLKGKVKASEGSYLDAIDLFTKVKSEAPTYLPVYLQLANTHLKIKEFEKAKTALDEAKNIAPLASVFLGYSKYYFDIGDMTSAMEHVSQFDTRELENKEDIFEAVLLKIKITTELTDKTRAVDVLKEEKEKFELVLDGWKEFEMDLNNLISKEKPKVEAVEPVNIRQVAVTEPLDLLEIFERYTKDKLISIVKFYKIRGYSKLNKKDLISLIIKEVYENKLWKTSLTQKELSLYNSLAEKGTSLSEEEVVKHSATDANLFFIELRDNTDFNDMKSDHGSLLLKGALIATLNDEKEWQLQLVR